MIVVNPYRIIRADRIQQRYNKCFINLSILLPVGFVISSIGGKVMKQRPNRFIAETLIEIFQILLRKKDRTAAKLRQRFGSAFVTNLIPDRASRPANPYQFGFTG